MRDLLHSVVTFANGLAIKLYVTGKDVIYNLPVIRNFVNE